MCSTKECCDVHQNEMTLSRRVDVPAILGVLGYVVKVLHLPLVTAYGYSNRRFHSCNESKRAALKRRPPLVHNRYELDGKYCDDLHIVRIDNHDFVFIYEIQKTLPLGIDLH